MRILKYPNERLRLLIDHFTDGNVAAFAREIKEVQQALDRLFKPSKTSGRFPAVKFEIYEKILIRYPDVSQIWLLSGAGPMLRILEDPKTRYEGETCPCYFDLPVTVDEKLKKLSEKSCKSQSQILSELIDQADL